MIPPFFCCHNMKDAHSNQRHLHLPRDRQGTQGWTGTKPPTAIISNSANEPNTRTADHPAKNLRSSQISVSNQPSRTIIKSDSIHGSHIPRTREKPDQASRASTVHMAFPAKTSNLDTESYCPSHPKLKPRWDVHLSGDVDQLGCAGESLSSVLGERPCSVV